MKLEAITLSEVREWKTNIIWHHLHIENLKKKTKKDRDELICRRATDSQTYKNMVTEGESLGGEYGLGVWHLYMYTEVYGIIGQWEPVI